MLCDPSKEPLEVHKIDFKLWNDMYDTRNIDELSIKLRSSEEVCPNGLFDALTTI